MDPYKIVERPLVTENAMNSVEESNIYMFRVSPNANKVQIKAAVEELYDVTVLSVNTANQAGKPRMYRRRYMSKTSPFKKAYVKLSDSDYIELI